MYFEELEIKPRALHTLPSTLPALYPQSICNTFLFLHHESPELFSLKQHRQLTKLSIMLDCGGLIFLRVVSEANPGACRAALLPGGFGKEPHPSLLRLLEELPPAVCSTAFLGHPQASNNTLNFSCF